MFLLARRRLSEVYARQLQESYRIFAGDVSSQHMILRFGACEVDERARQLVRAGRPVHLSAKAFDLLALLLSRQPGVVKKQDILHELWNGTSVVERNIANLVAEIREALEEDSPDAATAISFADLAPEAIPAPAWREHRGTATGAIPPVGSSPASRARANRASASDAVVLESNRTINPKGCFR
jgi:hypothetical protein